MHEELSSATKKPIDNYKFLCSNGYCFAFYIGIGGGHNADMTLTYFDRNKNRLNLSHYQYPPSNKEIHLSDKLDEMIHLAEVLSKNQSFARIDFYVVQGQIYFGEITKFPDSGFGIFTPQSFDLEWGKYINLPQKGDE